MAHGKNGRKAGDAVDAATKAFDDGCLFLKKHPIFMPLMRRAHIIRLDRAPYPEHGFADVDSNGVIRCHPKRRASADEWAYVVGHCLLHLAFDHFKEKPRPDAWISACDVFVSRFLDDLKLGCPPEEMVHHALTPPSADEQQLYERFCRDGVPDDLRNLGTAGDGVPDMLIVPKPRYTQRAESWPDTFSRGLRQAVANAVSVAAGSLSSLNAEAPETSAAQRARKWFIDSYPMLGGVASAFKIVETLEASRLYDISIAAVCRAEQEVYVNPLAALSYDECVFVIAHEILHAALRHDLRCNGRDWELW